MERAQTRTDAPLAKFALHALLQMTARLPPHLVLVLADDLGFHGVGYRNSDLRTPTIDALAHEGLQLDSFYTAKLCGPSRASLLTGRLPHKLQASQGNFAKFWAEEGEHTSYIMLPEQLHRRNYRTVLVGKWHAGFFRPNLLPTARGFDSFYGFLAGCQDHTNQRVCGERCSRSLFPGVDNPVDLHRNDTPALGENGTHGGFSHNNLRFGAAAVDSIRIHGLHHAHRRLFLYLALQDPHAPYQTPQRFENLYSHAQPLQNIWSGMVSAIDETLANITGELRAQRMWHETLLGVRLRADRTRPSLLRGADMNDSCRADASCNCHSLCKRQRQPRGRMGSGR